MRQQHVWPYELRDERVPSWCVEVYGDKRRATVNEDPWGMTAAELRAAAELLVRAAAELESLPGEWEDQPRAGE